MRKIDYKHYLDKVHGCWMGKCVAGTIGAPWEGAKELFDFEYSPQLIEKMIPNDDLDLQVLWLSVLEEKGVRFTSDDLADAFLNRCPYAPGEYGVFKKNYTRRIHPPVSGAFNNRYYIEGMGCPIRSEIWACIAPGNPLLAAKLAAMDGIMDHAGDSVYAEQFLSGVESAAFFEDDLSRLMDIGLGLIPSDSRFAELVRDVRRWCTERPDWRYVRSKVIREYGHPDCTNMHQNMGFTLLALFLGDMDFIKTTMIALNCGFDTDCSCATAGSILGIIYGADYLMKKHGFPEQSYILGVDAPRRSDKVFDLSEDTCMMGLHFAEHMNLETAIENAPSPPAIQLPPPTPVKISVEYNGIPAIGIGDTRRIRLLFETTADRPNRAKAAISVPQGWIANQTSTDLTLSPQSPTVWEIDLTVPSDIAILNETNILEVRFVPESGDEINYSFGITGAAVWEVFGPFWENNVQMPHLKVTDTYGNFMPSSSTWAESMDTLRTYHLNTRANLDRDYMSLAELTSNGSGDDAFSEGQPVNFYEDLMSVNDAVGFQGPCAVYMVRRMISSEDRSVLALVGHTDAYRLFINGKLVSSRDNVDWWTAENVHINDVSIKKGVNVMVVELIRRSVDAKFSLIFTRPTMCGEHYSDFASLNPKVVKDHVYAD